MIFPKKVSTTWMASGSDAATIPAKFVDDGQSFSPFWIIMFYSLIILDIVLIVDHHSGRVDANNPLSTIINSWLCAIKFWRSLI